MINQIKGLHHISSLASHAQINNRFFTHDLGIRRVKKTVNFDSPEMYHLYYGDRTGTPGTIMTYFPMPHIVRGKRGAGEVGHTVFAVPKGALDFWRIRLSKLGVAGLKDDSSFGEARLNFQGPDGDDFALAEVEDDPRQPWTGSDVPTSAGILGFHSAQLRLRDDGATVELLKLMGYQEAGRQDNQIRMVLEGGNGANFIDIQTLPAGTAARQGAGSVHHLAFAVPDRATQLELRKALVDTGYDVTPPIDRDYFWATYFRTPGGVLFEIATSEAPGFDRDEDLAHLGQGLMLPRRHEHLRPRLMKQLEQIGE